MRTENIKSKPSENSELSRIEIFIQERISVQNQNEVNQKQKVLQKQEGTKKDEMTTKDVIVKEVDPSKKKSDKSEEQVQLLTSYEPFVRTPGM